ncbi:MAG: UDP-3-O-(3-hydroxymyristoyl)glucosamine N-acyltransferase [Elusimicrobiota bacterium]
MTVSEIASLVQGTALGQLDCVITGVSTLSDAGPQDAAFLENPKYGPLATSSGAGCLFLPPEAKDAPCVAKARIITSEPRGAFTVLIQLIDQAAKLKILPTLSTKASIHGNAVLGKGVVVGDFTVIDKNVVVGDSSTIMAQCYLGANVKIGRGCLIYPQVVIREDCVIGDNVIIHPGTIIGADGFGFLTDRKTGKHTKIPQLGNVVIESGVEIGANVTIDRASLGSTVVKSGTQIDNLVQIGHNVKVGRDCVIVSQTGIAGSAIIGNNVILAGQSGVAGHITLGDGATLAAQSGAMNDVPPKSTVFGSPARPRRDAFKLLALYGRLPELFEQVKELEKKISGAAAQ